VASTRKFARFELIQTVGTGAFGTVYKARDPSLDRLVAVKMLLVAGLAVFFSLRVGNTIDRWFRRLRS
jgi:hypothetical protein